MSCQGILNEVATRQLPSHSLGANKGRGAYPHEVHPVVLTVHAVKLVACGDSVAVLAVTHVPKHGDFEAFDVFARRRRERVHRRKPARGVASNVIG